VIGGREENGDTGDNGDRKNGGTGDNGDRMKRDTGDNGDTEYIGDRNNRMETQEIIETEKN
jgi:hypothetical protein